MKLWAGIVSLGVWLAACGHQERPQDRTLSSEASPESGVSADAMESSLIDGVKDGRRSAWEDRLSEADVRRTAIRAVAVVLGKIGSTPAEGRANSAPTVRARSTLRIMEIRERTLRVIRACLPESLDLLPLLVQCELVQRDAPLLPRFHWLAVAVENPVHSAPRLTSLLESESWAVRQVCLDTLLAIYRKEADVGTSLMGLLRLRLGDDRDRLLILEAMQTVAVTQADDRAFLQSIVTYATDSRTKVAAQRILDAAR